MKTLLIETGDLMTDVAFSGLHGGKEIQWSHLTNDLLIVQCSIFDTYKITTAMNPIPFGSIEFCKKVALLHGISLPYPPNIPPSLYGIADREIREISGISAIDEYPVFVKPLNDVKAFPGFVAKRHKDFSLYPDVDWDNMPLFTSSVIRDRILAEWRFYINYGKVVGVGHYAGDPMKFTPRMRTLVQDVIKYYDDQPAAYSIDIAITDRPELIEINDAWALGNYGCDYLKYTQMVISRWTQIKNENNAATKVLQSPNQK